MEVVAPVTKHRKQHKQRPSTLPSLILVEDLTKVIRMHRPKSLALLKKAVVQSWETLCDSVQTTDNTHGNGNGNNQDWVPKINAYQRFVKSRMAEIKKEHSDWTIPTCMKHIASEWVELKGKDKSKDGLDAPSSSNVGSVGTMTTSAFIKNIENALDTDTDVTQPVTQPQTHTESIEGMEAVKGIEEVEAVEVVEQETKNDEIQPKTSSQTKKRRHPENDSHNAPEAPVLRRSTRNRK